MPKVSGGSTRARRITIGAAVSIAAAVAVAVWWSGALRGLADPAARAGDAYDQGQWGAADRAAREVLKLDPSEPSALRVLARSSARLGLDDKAIALYGQQIGPGRMEAE